MQEAFGTVIVGVTVIAAVVGLLTLLSSHSAYDQIGADGLDGGGDRPASEPSPAGVRDDEIAQMLRARNARRVRQGRPPLDVPAELERLEATPVAADPGLTAEVRELVRARNRRRVRRGEEPLAVEAEVARQLRELR